MKFANLTYNIDVDKLYEKIVCDYCTKLAGVEVSASIIHWGNTETVRQAFMAFEEYHIDCGDLSYADVMCATTIEEVDGLRKRILGTNSVTGLAEKLGAKVIQLSVAEPDAKQLAVAKAKLCEDLLTAEKSGAWPGPTGVIPDSLENYQRTDFAGRPIVPGHRLWKEE